MSLLAKWELRENANLRKRLAQIIQDAAYAISFESEQTARYAVRRPWALGVLAHPDAAMGEARRVQWRLTLNATVAAAGEAAPDGDLEYVFLAEVLPAILDELEALGVGA